MQVETLTALDNLDAILRVDGVHGVFIGPSDLAASMEKIGQGNDPELIAVCVDAVRKIKTAGKLAGIPTLSYTLIEQCEQAGADFIGTAVDTLLIGNAMREAAKKRAHR